MLELLILTLLGSWLLMALRSCLRKKSGCGRSCNGCCSACQGHCSKS